MLEAVAETWWNPVLGWSPIGWGATMVSLLRPQFRSLSCSQWNTPIFENSGSGTARESGGTRRVLKQEVG